MMEDQDHLTSEADATAAANAFNEVSLSLLLPPYTSSTNCRQFTRVSQVILNILIGKGGLFSANPLIGVPMTVVLHQLQTVLDVSIPHITVAFVPKHLHSAHLILTHPNPIQGTAFNLIDIIDSPNQKSRVSSNRSSIASYIYTAVATYLDLSLKKVKRGFVA